MLAIKKAEAACLDLSPVAAAAESDPFATSQRMLPSDAGYCSTTNLEACEEKGLDAYVSTSRQQ